jgi:hypothetical protein
VSPVSCEQGDAREDVLPYEIADGRPSPARSLDTADRYDLLDAVYDCQPPSRARPDEQRLDYGVQLPN